MLVFGYPDSKYQLRQTEEFERGKSAVEGRALGPSAWRKISPSKRAREGDEKTVPLPLSPPTITNLLKSLL